MQLFDAHCHVQDERLRPQLDAVLRRAERAGVAGMLCCGGDEEDWEQVRELARTYPAIKASFGLHPWYVGERTPNWLEKLRACLTDMPSAVGEIGLDHALDKPTFPAQEDAFVAQLELAQELRRPVTIHCRRAWGRMLELLDRHGVPVAGLMFHSYSGAKDFVPELCRRSAYFSFSGSITHSRNIRGKAAAAAVPLDRLLIETDAPDLLPALPPDAAVLRDADGQPLNEPAHLLHVLREVAGLRGLSAEALAPIVWENTVRVFGVTG